MFVWLDLGALDLDSDPPGRCCLIDLDPDPLDCELLNPAPESGSTRYVGREVERGAIKVRCSHPRLT